MIFLKKYALSVSLLASSLAFSQTSMVSSTYPQMYENQMNQNKEVSKTAITAKDQIDISISEMISDPVLRNAHWGFVIYDPSTKKVVNSYNASDSFVPASTTKLLTTEAAMSLLGSKFHWTTQLEYSGNIDTDGTLNGNLYIVGSGDPSLGTRKAGSYSYSEIVSDFIQALSDKGIKKVTGDIILQTAVFKDNKIKTLPENIVWLEQSDYYLPVGSTQNIDPRNEKIIVKQNHSFQKDSKKYFYVSPYTKQMVYSDTFNTNPIITKVADVPNYLAKNFKVSLSKNGIPVLGNIITKITDNEPEKRNIITSYKSPDLKDIISDTNHRSDNAMAEAILRTLGFQKYGDQSSESGRNAVTSHLNDINFEMAGLSYMDGSGLSKSNYVTPMAQVKFLAGIMNTPYYKDFQESLPIAGQTGTLKKMFFGNSYGQIFAKTGTLNKVKCLAGYLKTRAGKMLTFSMLVNNYSGSVDQVKARMEKLLDSAIEL